MQGTSFHEGCPTPLSALRALEIRHWGYDGKVHEGLLVLAAEEVPAITQAMQAIFEAKFPIESLRPVSEFGGDDGASMAANNSSAFNCRAVTGGKAFSEHAYGRAIDLNPLTNPFVRQAKRKRRAAAKTNRSGIKPGVKSTAEEKTQWLVEPEAGRAYLDRTQQASGLLRAGEAGVQAFDAIGWSWGGRWRSLKDYQHFSRSGR